nr:MAG TPA: hypothetical protein [Caudoviricetes sp.]
MPVGRKSLPGHKNKTVYSSVPSDLQSDGYEYQDLQSYKKS